MEKRFMMSKKLKQGVFEDLMIESLNPDIKSKLENNMLKTQQRIRVAKNKNAKSIHRRVLQSHMILYRGR